MKRKTSRIVVRPYTLKDFEAWREGHLARAPKKNKFDYVKPLPRELRQKKFKALVLKCQKRAKKDECYIYGIFDKKTGKHLGITSLYIFLRKGIQWANLGYEIHNHYWKMGYGAEAALMTLKIGFTKLKLHRIEAAMELDHKGSIGVARAIGMRREGIRRKFFPNPSGWEDLVVFGAVKEDYCP